MDSPPYHEVKHGSFNPPKQHQQGVKAKHYQRLTEDGELLVSLQGFLASEREVKPTSPGHVQLHGAAKDLQVGRCSLYGLCANLDPHASHYHRAVVVGHFDGETPRL